MPVSTRQCSRMHDISVNKTDFKKNPVWSVDQKIMQKAICKKRVYLESYELEFIRQISSSPVRVFWGQGVMGQKAKAVRLTLTQEIFVLRDGYHKLF